MSFFLKAEQIQAMKTTCLLFLVLFAFLKNSTSQSISNSSGVQDSLSKTSSRIWKQKTDSTRIHSSEVFLADLQSVLKSDAYKAIPFDSIQGITRVASDDGVLRIFTWNVPLSSGLNKYYGCIQIMQNGTFVIPLQSTIGVLNCSETDPVLPQDWYGALYYKLIQVVVGEKKVYTLLGWDGYTADANRKFIDIISIDENGNLVFGMPVFKTDQGIKSRIILEYTEKSNMLLRYDYQAIRVEKRKKIKKEYNWLIVMDHLVPIDISFLGIKKYYVPSGDTYDGFVFNNGYWVLVEDIDVANSTEH